MKPGDFIVALLLSISQTGCMGGLPPATPPVRATSTTEEIRALAELVNKHRRSVGCKDLEWLEPVAAVAQKHSDDMVRRNFFDHKNPEGVTPFQRLNAAGIRFTRAAENIAYGQETAQAVLASWLRSPGHRRNIEDCAMREHGIGFARGTKTLPYGTMINAWTHNFVVLRP
jgi:uncharacterized protein YkwD